VGKGKQWARTELEKLDLQALSKEDALVAAAKIILGAASEASSGGIDKESEIEFGWVDAATQRHQIVAPDLTLQAITKAKELMTAEMQYDVS
jgi:20S proteasome subunit alpha 7